MYGITPAGDHSFPVFGNAREIFYRNSLATIFNSQTMQQQAYALQHMAETRQLLDHARILVIEDDRVFRMMLMEILDSYGFRQVREATNGLDGLDITNQWQPHLVITDIVMPIMDGIAYCQAVRGNDDLRHTPILVQTSGSDTTQRNAVFQAGATDFLSKPVDPHELAARCFVHLEREMLMRSLMEYKSRLSRELELARRMQSVLVPGDEAIRKQAAHYRLDIQRQFTPCSELGGDLWGTRSIDAHRLAVFTADFTGHGVDAALNTFRLHAVMHNMPEPLFSQPGSYVQALNQTLHDLLPVEQFATMFYGVIDTKAETLTYCPAACPPPMMYRHASGGVEQLERKGLPLGIEPDAKHLQITVPFNAGDALLLFSDALTESVCNDTGKALDDSHIAELLAEGINRSGNGRDGFSAIIDYLNKHCSGNVHDDLTVCLFQRH